MKLKIKYYRSAIRFMDYMLLLSFLMLLISSCSSTKTLKNNEFLYQANKLEIKDRGKFQELGLKRNLKKQVKPEPNDRFFGVAPVKLWIYNLVGDSIPEKGVRSWIRRKFGQAPVIYKSFYAQQNKNAIQEYLFNNGYFNASANSSVNNKGKKITVLYSLQLNRQFTYDTIVFPKVKDSLTRYINESKSESLLKSGKAYKLKELEDERIRINAFLKNKGFYFFDPNFLIFEVDSNDYKASVAIDLKVKTNIPQNASQQYYINKITVDSDYSLNKLKENKDTLMVDNLMLLYTDKVLKPKIIQNSIMFNTGDLYNYNAYTQTLNKFSGLGIYKFTNIRYKQTQSDSTLLNANIYLTKSVPRSVRTVVRAVTKSNDYLGPEITLSYRDRNLLNGAELFTLNLNSSFETQFGNENEGGNSYEVGFDANLSVPRFIFPIIDLNKYLSEKYTPKTNLRVGYSYHFRTKYFKMNTFNLLYGYNWNETLTKSHDLKTINLSYSRLTDRTNAFEEILSENELLRQSFEEKLMLSLSYTYKINTSLSSDLGDGIFLTVNPEIAGQLLSLYNYFVRGYFPSSENPSKILGIKYSQFARISADFRWNKTLREGSMLATRFFAGVGSAYGNSDVLPYIKQFYIGGASDIRAFFSHTVGPGSYYPPDSIENNYFDQVGEIKLESNIEYRFDIISFLKGAVFIDAGNIWLLEPNPQKPGGEFNINSVFDQLAIGGGFGLRLDASVLVLRLDLGVPLRKPWLAANDRWVIDDFNLGSAAWRRNNLVLNIAIGYPF
ncbi:MAG: BamA/TamA family outer membrane protein [Bacteroidetes bacterium]|nr:BamA/TamA family outer membrane protein [Bacteroidota bacterium]